MKSILPSLVDRGIESYYGGWRPPLIDLRSAPDFSALQAAAEDYVMAAARIREKYRRSPGPKALMEDLLRVRKS